MQSKTKYTFFPQELKRNQDNETIYKYEMVIRNKVYIFILHDHDLNAVRDTFSEEVKQMRKLLLKYFLGNFTKKTMVFIKR